ncbi:hypothetical protein AMTRI_Chr03g148870 [Amborella trichopoda]
MSQGQPQRPIKYGDAFAVSGDHANQTVAPRDAAMMQSAEGLVLGLTQKGGAAAATMHSAADRNEAVGAVAHEEFSAVGEGHGVTVAEAELPDRRVVVESVGGQVVRQFAQALSQGVGQLGERTGDVQGGGELRQGAGDLGEGKLTIGEALEATGLTAGHKVVEQSDASAIEEAEMRASGRSGGRSAVCSGIKCGGREG